MKKLNNGSNSLFSYKKCSVDGGGGVHNMLRVQVCAAHGIWVGFDPKILQKGSLFHLLFLKHRWVFQKLAKKYSRMGSSLPRLIIKVGMTASFNN